LKRLISFLIIILIIISNVGCSAPWSKDSGYRKYSYEFLGSFDTIIQFIGYTKNEKEFEKLSNIGQARFEELHKLYDIYNSYDGINNIKTINDNAGIKPVEVKKEIIDIILFSKEWNLKTNGRVNIALGPVLELWHIKREEAKTNPSLATLPEMLLLKNAMLKTDINKVIVDSVKNTVFLQEVGMSLDIGAVAKGFATEIVANELINSGFSSFIVSSGGNIRAVGKPLDGARSKWGIGIQDPNQDTALNSDNILDTVYVNDMSVVSSGDYQRYYVINDKKIHHIIDPDTLMPSDYFRAVTVMTKDSGLADFLSTTLFLLPYDKGLELIKSLDGVEALWVFPDGSIKATENMKNQLKTMGGASNK